jgi:hypothetical protein
LDVSEPPLLLLLRLLLAAAKTNDSQLTGTYAPTSVGAVLGFYEEDRSGLQNKLERFWFCT